MHRWYELIKQGRLRIKFEQKRAKNFLSLKNDND